MAENLAELCCSSVLWKENLQGMKLDKLAEEISKQTAEGVACFFLIAYSEIREERWTEGGIIKQKGARTWNLKNSQPICISSKMDGIRKQVLETPPWVCLNYHSEKNSWDCTRTNTGSLNGRWTRQNEGRLRTGWQSFPNMYASSKEGKNKSWRWSRDHEIYIRLT